MRKFLMIASAAAMAISMPAVAKEKGGGGGGGGKPEKHQGGGGHGGGGHGGGGKAHKESRGGGGGGGNPFGAQLQGGGHGGFKAERRMARQERRGGGEWRARGKAEKQWARAEKRERKIEKSYAKADRGYAKAERKAWKQDTRRVERLARRDERRDIRNVREDRSSPGYDYRYQQRYADNFGGACPPGLARKNNGCLPPGQAKKMFGGAQFYNAGQVLPVEYYSDYNIPAEYQNWYQDNPDNYYRYDDNGYIYQVDRQSNLIESLIPLLGGGFGVGQLLPAGFDSYNLPMQYRDDYQDSDEAYYRYGDDAIYEVDPQSNMIESIVALLSGDLNVGSMLPSGYDTYNLPMEYRDDYVDDADSMYRYADGNIYEVDPQTQIIEQIVASLV
nr:hypothetical protein [uncultured Sphingosinicella sp.]